MINIITNSNTTNTYLPNEDNYDPNFFLLLFIRCICSVDYLINQSPANRALFCIRNNFFVFFSLVPLFFFLNYRWISVNLQHHRIQSVNLSKVPNFDCFEHLNLIVLNIWNNSIYIDREMFEKIVSFTLVLDLFIFLLCVKRHNFNNINYACDKSIYEICMFLIYLRNSWEFAHSVRCMMSPCWIVCAFFLLCFVKI